VVRATRNNASRTRPGPQPEASPAGGFTLIELLTIIVILSMLITLTAPSILEARKLFKMEQTRGIIKDLGGACRLYANDWEEYPPSGGGVTKGLKGRYALVQALIGYMDGPTDGIDGPGAASKPRVGSERQSRGKKLGPYTKAKFTSTPETSPVFADAFSNEIYYYRFALQGGGGKGKYDDSDNTDPRGPASLQEYLQDPNGDYYRKDYVLITPGPDRKWLIPGQENPDDPNKVKKTDDLANFPFWFVRP
jgi:type II secretory pathway pseudopilin PulG